MEKAIARFIASIEFGKVQRHENMAIVPLFTKLEGGLDYLTLKEALSKELIVVKEIDEEGLVHVLTVLNRSDSHVLLLDGEELVGAKQNRVLNTTILLRPGSETMIPVSCTEQGRWSYTTEKFTDSGLVMGSGLRKIKARSVASSLSYSRDFRSDQDAVWDGIHELSRKAGFRSSTDAMKDVIESRLEDLDAYSKAFELVAGQKGLFVFVNGKPDGFDIVSCGSAYKEYHGKLVKSYAMDAVLEKASSGGDASEDKAKAFLKTVLSCREKRYESKGLGLDYRYESETMVGSALACEDVVVHMAFFNTEGTERKGRVIDFISGANSRRGFRM